MVKGRGIGMLGGASESFPLGSWVVGPWRQQLWFGALEVHCAQARGRLKLYIRWSALCRRQRGAFGLRRGTERAATACLAPAEDTQDKRARGKSEARGAVGVEATQASGGGFGPSAPRVQTRWTALR